MKKHIFAILLSTFLLTPSAVSATNHEAHFYVRYDNTVQDENGNTHYSASNYFPIGDTEKGYTYGSNKTDVSSADGIVKSNTAFVDGAEKIITGGNVNIYNSFKVNKDTVKSLFKVVYDDITQLPSEQVLAKSIEKALGADWKEAYEDKKVDFLWYVVKQEEVIHVDGVLYWVNTGDVVDKGEDVDEFGKPEEPTPVDPELTEEETTPEEPKEEETVPSEPEDPKEEEENPSESEEEENTPSKDHGSVDIGGDNNPTISKPERPIEEENTVVDEEPISEINEEVKEDSTPEIIEDDGIGEADEEEVEKVEVAKVVDTGDDTSFWSLVWLGVVIFLGIMYHLLDKKDQA